MMINIKAIIVGLSLSVLVSPIYSLDIFGASGGPINETMMDSMETKIDEYVDKSLDSSLKMFNMSDLLSGDTKNFQNDLNTGVNKVVQDSLKFSFDLQKDIMSGVAQDISGLQDKLNPFIQKTIKDSLDMGEMSDQSSQLFDQKEFQANLSKYLTDTISSSLANGLKPLTQGLSGKKMTGDFFRSSNFIDSFENFSKQDANYNSKSDEDDEMLDSMGEDLDKSLSTWGDKFGKDMESWGDNFGKQMEDFGENLGKSIESQMNNMFGDD